MLLALSLSATGSLQAQASDDYPRGADAVPLLREVRAVGIAEIYPRTLAERFGDETFRRLEDALRSSGDVALADVLNPFLLDLGVSHTRFFDRRHQGFYMLRSLFSSVDIDAPELYTIGVQLDDDDPGFVRAVLDGSAAESAGILRGDRIVAVDGRAFTSLLQWQVPGSVALTVEGDGDVRSVTVTPVHQSLHRAFARATGASREIIECGTRRIGYLHLWSGTDDAFLAALEDAVADARARRVDGFVLDLRDGYGGAWWDYLDPFFEDRADYFQSVYRDRSGAGEPMRAEPGTNRNVWRGPLAVLINSGTRSGKEALAFQFRKSGRAPLFGSTTAGAFTAGRGVFADRDGAGYILFLAVAEPRLDGRVIEGEGVSPDVVVSDEYGRDAPLAAALDHLGCRND